MKICTIHPQSVFGRIYKNHIPNYSSFEQPPTKRADLKSLKSDDQTWEEYCQALQAQGISPTDVWLSRRQTNNNMNNNY